MAHLCISLLPSIHAPRQTPLDVLEIFSSWCVSRRTDAGQDGQQVFGTWVRHAEGGVVKETQSISPAREQVCAVCFGSRYRWHLWHCCCRPSSLLETLLVPMTLDGQSDSPRKVLAPLRRTTERAAHLARPIFTQVVDRLTAADDGNAFGSKPLQRFAQLQSSQALCLGVVVRRWQRYLDQRRQTI